MSSSDPVRLREALTRKPVIAIIRASSPTDALTQGAAALATGIGALEVSATTPGWDDVVAELVGKHPNAAIGAGTITTPERASQAADAGADFLLSPGLPAQFDAVLAAGLPLVPGIFTPSDALVAADHGISLMKLFPASAVGPQYVSALKAPLPDVDLIAVGGVLDHGVDAWLAAGAVGVGIGSDLGHYLESQPPQEVSHQ